MRFTVHRPTDVEVSPCGHRPSGGDVACGVHVGIARPGLAGDAPENRLALAILRCNMPACGASLRRVRGRDLFDPAKCLVLQSRDEFAPPAAKDRTVESPLLSDPATWTFGRSSCTAGHTPNIESFDSNRVESTGDVGAGLFHPVLPTVGLARPQFSDGQLRSGTTVRPLLGARKSTLQHFQPACLPGTQMRYVHQFARRQRRRNSNATVYAYDASVTGAGDRLGYVREGNMPAAGPVKGHPVRLHRFGHVPGEPESHPPNLGYKNLAVAPVQPLYVCGFDPYLAESFMNAGFAPRRSSVGAVEEVAHRLGEIPKRLLLQSRRTGGEPVEFGARIGQLSTLLGKARRSTAWTPVILLLNSQIPYVSGLSAVPTQRNGLFLGRKEAVSGHTRNIASTTDNNAERRCVALPRSGCINDRHGVPTSWRSQT